MRDYQESVITGQTDGGQSDPLCRYASQATQKNCMCHLRNIALRDYQESVTTGQTDTGQSDPYGPLCLAGDTMNACVAWET